MVTGVLRAPDLKSGNPGFKSCLDRCQEFFLGSPEFNLLTKGVEESAKHDSANLAENRIGVTNKKVTLPVPAQFGGNLFYFQLKTLDPRYFITKTLVSRSLFC